MNSYYYRHKDLNQYLGLGSPHNLPVSSSSRAVAVRRDLLSLSRGNSLHTGSSYSPATSHSFLSTARLLPSRFRRHSVDHTSHTGNNHLHPTTGSMAGSMFGRGGSTAPSAGRSSSVRAVPAAYPFTSTTGPSSYERLSGGGARFHPDISEIQPYLYVSAAFPVTSKAVRDLGITCIINITCEVARQAFPTHLDYIHLQLNDHPEERIDGYFSYAADKIRSHRQCGGRTLVHCVAGRSRSVSLVLAYLMKYESMRLLDAYNLVKGRRPIIHPNLGFWKQLVQYESSLFGFNSVHMVKHSRFGLIPDVYERQYSNLIW